MQVGEIKIRGFKLPYFFKDNKVKKTILMIHGFNSSASFCENLFSQENNYNIISLDLPGSNTNPHKDSLTIATTAQIVNEFINFINTKIYVLGHSLAGGILTKIHNNPQIEGLIFLSTIHPKITFVKTYQILQKYNNPNSRISKIPIDKILNFSTTIISKWVNTLTKPPKGFNYIIKKEMFNEKYVKKTLNEEFQSINKKTMFGVGKYDFIIGTKYLEEYVTNDLKQKIIVFPNAGHNPIKDQPYFVNNWLNSNLSKKYRIFHKNIIKQK